MTLTGLNLPFSRALTPDDLDRIPWRGAKFELYDGVLVVSPAPNLRHQPPTCPAFAPGVRAWQLVDGVYVEVGSARGAESLTLDAPFELTVVPQTLTER